MLRPRPDGGGSLRVRWTRRDLPDGLVTEPDP